MQTGRSATPTRESLLGLRPGAAPEVVDGVRQRVVRCRLPFVLDARLDGGMVLDGDEARAATGRPVARAAGEPEVVEPPNPGGAPEELPEPRGRACDMLSGPVLHGVASSTGVDSYGTEMSRAALDMMAAQCRAGEVPYLPTHPQMFGGGGEWDDVIGYMAAATVVRGDVRAAADPAEASFRMDVAVQLDESDSRAVKLAERVKKGLPVGQSIGGWFTELRFIYAEEDAGGEWADPERVIVEGVELDHVAATRRPSNTDSWITSVRSAVRAAHAECRSALAAAPAEPIAEPDSRDDVPAAAPEGDGSDTTPLDTAAAPRHDTGDAGRDALEGAPGGETVDDNPPATPTDEEPSMTAAELSALLDAKLAPIASRLDTVEARATVPPPPGERAASATDVPAPAATEDAEVVALRARAAALEAQVADSYRTGRRGRAPVAHIDAARADTEIAALCRSAEGEAPELVAVVRQAGFVERRAVGPGAGIEKIEAMRAGAESDLFALLNAGVDAGLIRDPGESTGSWA